MNIEFILTKFIELPTMLFVPAQLFYLLLILFSIWLIHQLTKTQKVAAVSPREKEEIWWLADVCLIYLKSGVF